MAIRQFDRASPLTLTGLTPAQHRILTFRCPGYLFAITPSTDNADNSRPEPQARRIRESLIYEANQTVTYVQ